MQECVRVLTEGQCDEPESALNAYLMPNLPASVTVIDPSLEVLALLRILHALSYHWYTLYEVGVLHCTILLPYAFY